MKRKDIQRSTVIKLICILNNIHNALSKNSNKHSYTDYTDFLLNVHLIHNEVQKNCACKHRSIFMAATMTNSAHALMTAKKISD